MSIRRTPNSTQVPINIVGSSTFGRYSKISLEKTYNMFISDEWLVNFSGYQRVLNLAVSGNSRGIFRSVRGNFLLAVVDNEVFRIQENLGYILVGSLQTASGDVYIDENLNNQICIVDGLNAYIYNHTLAPQLVIQSLAVGLVPSCVSYHNTFFLFGNGNNASSGAKWYVYQPATDTTISLVGSDGLGLQTKPDFPVAVKRIPGHGNNILVMGTTVCEIWTQIGGTYPSSIPIPYQRNPTVNIDYGCLSVSTIAENDNYIAWLGVNESNAPVIMVYGGGEAQPISTDGIDYVLEQLQYPEQSTAMFFRKDGHNFYQLTFYNDADNLTLVFDFTTKKFFNLTDWNLNFHPAADIVYFNNKSYFISLLNASLYEFSSNYTTYNDNLYGATPDENLNHEIPRIRICKNVRAEDARRFIANSLVITMEQGTDPGLVGADYDTINYIVSEGVQDKMLDEDGEDYIVAEDSGMAQSPYFINSATTPAYQPRVDLSISINGGVSFGNWVSRPLRPQGLVKNVITWEKMGAANDLILKFRFVGTSRFIVNNGVLDIY